MWKVVPVGFGESLTQMSRGHLSASCLADLGFVFNSCCYKLTFPQTAFGSEFYLFILGL